MTWRKEINIDKLAEGECPLPPEWHHIDMEVYALTSNGAPSNSKE
jgi:hypothetical protein